MVSSHINNSLEPIQQRMACRQMQVHSGKEYGGNKELAVRKAAQQRLHAAEHRDNALGSMCIWGCGYVVARRAGVVAGTGCVCAWRACTLRAG